MTIAVYWDVKHKTKQTKTNSDDENNLLLNNLMSSVFDENFARIVVMGGFDCKKY